MKHAGRWLTIAAALALFPLPVAASPAAFQRSYELEAAGQAREAVAALRRASADAQRGYFYQLRLGWLLYAAQDHREAIAAYQRAAALQPQAVEAWLGMLLPQLALRLWQDAEGTARKALRLDGQSYLGRSRLAWALYNLGRYGESERVYRSVLAGYPADLEMQAGLGWALLKQGKRGDAAGVFRALLAVSPQNRSALDGAAAAAGR